MIDWKRKLTSRKFWLAIAGFVTAILVFLKSDEGTTTQVTALVMAGAEVIAYIIGEGLADSAKTETIIPDVYEEDDDIIDDDEEDEEDIEDDEEEEEE